MNNLLQGYSESIYQRRKELEERVAKKLLNIVGYPNNIEVFISTHNGNEERKFVDLSSGDVLAVINHGMYQSECTIFIGEDNK